MQIIFSSVSVAEWPPFGKMLPAQLTLCSFCILSTCTLINSRFGFDGRILVLIAPVPGHCLLVAFNIEYLRNNFTLL